MSSLRGIGPSRHLGVRPRPRFETAAGTKPLILSNHDPSPPSMPLRPAAANRPCLHVTRGQARFAWGVTAKHTDKPPNGQSRCSESSLAGDVRTRRLTGLQVMALLRGYCEQGSLIAVTHNPEILTEADLVITLRDGQVSNMESRLKSTQQARIL